MKKSNNRNNSDRWELLDYAQIIIAWIYNTK